MTLDDIVKLITIGGTLLAIAVFLLTMKNDIKSIKEFINQMANKYLPEQERHKEELMRLQFVAEDYERCKNRDRVNGRQRE